MKILIQMTLFGGAMLVGWLGREAVAGSQSSEPQAIVRGELGKLDFEAGQLRFYDGVADRMVDADSKGMGELAAQFIAEEVEERRVWNALFTRWFEKDPKGAWAFVGDHFLEGSGVKVGEIAIEQWALIDPLAARAALGSPTASQFEALIRGAMMSDVELAFELMREGELNYPNHSYLQDWGGRMLREKIAEYAVKDPGAALDWAESRSEPKLLGSVLSGWVLRDPAGARAWLNQREDRERVLIEVGNFLMGSEFYHPEIIDFVASVLPPGNDRSEVLQEMIESLAYKDPDRSVLEAHRLFTNQSDQAEAIAKIASIVAKSDFEKAWEILGGIDPSVTGIRRVSIPRLEMSKGGVIEEMSGRSRYWWDLTSMRGLVWPGEIKSQMLADLLMVDKARALNFMSNLPPEQLLLITDETMERWMSHDPVEAVSWMATRLGDGGEVDDILFGSWFLDFAEDQERAQTVLKNLPEGTARTALARYLASDFGDGNPEETLEVTRETGGDAEAITDVYGGWASKNPGAALESLIADVEAPAEAWGAVASKAFREMPEETAQIVNALPEGKSRDAAMLEIAGVCAEDSHPIAGAEWALAIGDETMRAKGLESILERSAMDLRLSGEFAEDFREIIGADQSLSGEQKKHWLNRVEAEFSKP
ncbi:hypothetical protein V2O64_14155 [Verrucomicrobiaceae bacterium 227]